MPIALDSSETFAYVFSTDREKSGDQPTLIFHYPTCREKRNLARLFDEAFDSQQKVYDDKLSDDERQKAYDDHIKLRCDALRTILVDWKNFKRNDAEVPYNPAELDDVLTDLDFTELEQNLLKELTISEREKKVSAFSRLSKRESSADVAVKVNA